MEECKGIAVSSATGLDVGDNYSHYYIVGEDGAVREEGLRLLPSGQAGGRGKMLGEEGSHSPIDLAHLEFAMGYVWGAK